MASYRLGSREVRGWSHGKLGEGKQREVTRGEAVEGRGGKVE